MVITVLIVVVAGIGVYINWLLTHPRVAVSVPLPELIVGEWRVEGGESDQRWYEIRADGTFTKHLRFDPATPRPYRIEGSDRLVLVGGAVEYRVEVLNQDQVILHRDGRSETLNRVKRGQ